VRIDPPAELRAVLHPRPRAAHQPHARGAAETVAMPTPSTTWVARRLVAALASGDLSLLSAMCEDRLHEPYRAAIYPEFPRWSAARRPGALGAALSGAGSTVIALPIPAGRPPAIATSAGAQAAGRLARSSRRHAFARRIG
jgi:homoserine kinase